MRNWGSTAAGRAAALHQIDWRRNRLIAALPAACVDQWRSFGEPVRMRQGDSLYEPGGSVGFVHFPIDLAVALLSVLATGASIQIGVVGFEGLVGVSAFLGGGTMTTRAVIQVPGVAIRVPAELVKAAFDECGEVMHLLLRYTQALMAQLSQTAVCNRYHRPDQQLCRWLLVSLDRVAASEVVTTHELTASMLGVRRETVTDAIRRLQALGLIHSLRGRIQVLDRAGLERYACECYGVVRREYERLLPP